VIQATLLPIVRNRCVGNAADPSAPVPARDLTAWTQKRSGESKDAAPCPTPTVS